MGLFKNFDDIVIAIRGMRMNLNKNIRGGIKYEENS